MKRFSSEAFHLNLKLKFSFSYAFTVDFNALHFFQNSLHNIVNTHTHTVCEGSIQCINLLWSCSRKYKALHLPPAQQSQWKWKCSSWRTTMAIKGFQAGRATFQQQEKRPYNPLTSILDAPKSRVCCCGGGAWVGARWSPLETFKSLPSPSRSLGCA